MKSSNYVPPPDDVPPHPGDPNRGPLPNGDWRALPPPPDRDSLSLAAWLKREIPPRDHLLGGVMCTTSRWFVFGETGIGKTLLFMDATTAAAIAFLKWAGQRRARVMYVDGELPIETFKERMQLIAARYGDDIQFYGYNREDLGDDGLPPLNTEQGQNWLRREIDAIKPDLIIFNSIFCLLVGSAKEEDTWAPVKTLVRELTRRHIAQIWLNQANEIGKSFGDKTREWEMDTVVKLSRPIGEDGEDLRSRRGRDVARIGARRAEGRFCRGARASAERKIRIIDPYKSDILRSHADSGKKRPASLGPLRALV